MNKQSILKNKLLGFQRRSFIMSVIIISLLTFQTVNGKYLGHASLAWGWTLSLIIPLTVIATSLRTIDQRLFKGKFLQTLKTGRFLTSIYFILIGLTLIVVIPFAWLNSGIGYVAIFKNSFWGFIAMQFLIILIIFSGVKFPFQKKAPLAEGLEIQRQDLASSKASFNAALLNDKEEILATIEKCRKHIVDNKISQAAQLLKKLFKDNGIDEPIELTLIPSEWNKIENDKNLDLIDFKNANLRFANLRKALLAILDSIKV